MGLFGQAFGGVTRLPPRVGDRTDRHRRRHRQRSHSFRARRCRHRLSRRSRWRPCGVLPLLGDRHDRAEACRPTDRDSRCVGLWRHDRAGLPRALGETVGDAGPLCARGRVPQRRTVHGAERAEMQLVRPRRVARPAMNLRLQRGIVGPDELAGAAATLRLGHPRHAAIRAKATWFRLRQLRRPVRGQGIGTGEHGAVSGPAASGRSAGGTMARLGAAVTLGP